MSNAKDITGQKFGKLIALSRCDNINGRVAWKCKCDCGNNTIVKRGDLISGHTRSCGCLRKASIDISGSKFGKLTVLRMEGHGVGNDHNKSNWLCKCECGNTIIAKGSALRYGTIKSCGCSRTLNLSGRKFGNLTVVSSYANNGMWSCKCECGNHIDINSQNLLSGSVKSCGCLRRLPFGVAAANRIYNNYIRGSSYRGHDFSIDKELFLDFITRACYYCGRDPYTSFKTYGPINGTILYNGIDRVDNEIGYIESNIVSCCKECNLAKGTMTHDQFINMCRLVANSHKDM